MRHKFIIDIGGDPNHEDLVAEIYCGDQPKTDFVAMVNQDAGLQELEIQVYPRPDGKPWRFNLHEFKQALDRAQAGLNELRRGT
jgi:hypothetical protein